MTTAAPPKLSEEREQLIEALGAVQPSAGDDSITLPRQLFERVQRYLEQPLIKFVQEYYGTAQDGYGEAIRDEVRGYLEALTPEQLEAAGLQSVDDVKLVRFGTDEWDNGYFFDSTPDLILTDDKNEAKDENTLDWNDVFGFDGAPVIEDTGDLTDAFGPIGRGYELWIDMQSGDVIE